MKLCDENISQSVKIQKRQYWMKVLALQVESLLEYQNQLTKMPYELIRKPEVGLVMMRGKSDGRGKQFNVGEATVSRCTVKIGSGEIGFGYVLGNSKTKATLIALADAYLQSSEHDYWFQLIISSLEKNREKEIHRQEKEVSSTKVDFFTLVRGES